MCKIINPNGEIFRIDGTHIYSEKQKYKGAPTENHTFDVKNIPIETILALPEFEGFSEFTDTWDYLTKYRYFATNNEIAKIAIALPSEQFAILQTIKRTTYQNGVELYFDSIEEWMSPFIDLIKLEINNDLV